MNLESWGVKKESWGQSRGVLMGDCAGELGEVEIERFYIDFKMDEI